MEAGLELPEPSSRLPSLGFLSIVVILGAAALVGPVLAAQPDLLEIVPTAADWETRLGAIAVALVIAVIVLRFPAAGLVALALVVGLHLSQVLVRHHGFPSFLQCLAFPMALAAGVERLSEKRASWVPRGLSLWLVGYTLVVLASAAIAADRSLADERGLEVTKGLVLYGLVAGLAVSMARIWLAVSSLLLAGAVTAGLGIYQALSGELGSDFGGLARIKHAQIYGDVFEPRIAGPFGDPNFFAQMLVLLVPLALYAAWAERENGVRAQAPYYALALVLASASILTYSRGGALALAVVLVLAILDRGMRARTVLAAVALSAVVALLLPDEFTRRLETMEELLPGGEATKPDSSFAERKLYAASALGMFLDHPLTGVGAGNYTSHYEVYATRVGSAARAYAEPTARHYPHSLGLEIAAETGLVGLALFVGAIVASLASLERSRYELGARHERRGEGLARGLQIALVGYLVAALFLHGDFQRPLWFALGLVGALASLSRKRESEHEEELTA